MAGDVIRQKEALHSHMYNHIHPDAFVSYFWLNAEFLGELMTNLTISYSRIFVFVFFFKLFMLFVQKTQASIQRRKENW